MTGHVGAALVAALGEAALEARAWGDHQGRPYNGEAVATVARIERTGSRGPRHSERGRSRVSLQFDLGYNVFAAVAVASPSPQIGDFEPSPQLRGR